MGRRSIAAVVACAVLAAPALARADRGLVDPAAIHDDRGIAIGVIAAGGYGPYASPTVGLAPTAQGLVLRDRNGFTARMIFALITAAAGGISRRGLKRESASTTEVRTTERYVDENGQTREVTTWSYNKDSSTYRPLTEAEKADLARATESTTAAIGLLRHSDFELHVFSRDRFGVGEASGYRLNAMIGGGRPIAFEAGLGIGLVVAVVDHEGMPTEVRSSHFGVPLRVSRVIGPVRAALTVEWNWLGGNDSQIFMDDAGPYASTDNDPWHLEVSTVLLRRVLVSAEVVTPNLLDGKFGYSASAAMLF